MFETAYIAIAVFMAIFSLYGILLSYRVCLMPNRCVPASGSSRSHIDMICEPGFLHQVAEDRLSHRRAANIAQAYK